MAIVGEKTTRKFVGVGALDDPPVNKTISPINQNLNADSHGEPKRLKAPRNSPIISKSGTQKISSARDVDFIFCLSF